MTTRVVKIVECDRCQSYENAPTVTELPVGWWRLVQVDRGIHLHFCAACGDRTRRYAEGRTEA